MAAPLRFSAVTRQSFRHQRLKLGPDLIADASSPTGGRRPPSSSVETHVWGAPTWTAGSIAITRGHRWVANHRIARPPPSWRFLSWQRHSHAGAPRERKSRGAGGPARLDVGVARAPVAHLLSTPRRARVSGAGIGGPPILHLLSRAQPRQPAALLRIPGEAAVSPTATSSAPVLLRCSSAAESGATRSLGHSASARAGLALSDNPAIVRRACPCSSSEAGAVSRLRGLPAAALCAGQASSG